MFSGRLSVRPLSVRPLTLISRDAYLPGLEKP